MKYGFSAPVTTDGLRVAIWGGLEATFKNSSIVKYF